MVSAAFALARLDEAAQRKPAFVRPQTRTLLPRLDLAPTFAQTLPAFAVAACADPAASETVVTSGSSPRRNKRDLVVCIRPLSRFRRVTRDQLLSASTAVSQEASPPAK